MQTIGPKGFLGKNEKCVMDEDGNDKFRLEMFNGSSSLVIKTSKLAWCTNLIFYC